MFSGFKVYNLLQSNVPMAVRSRRTHCSTGDNSYGGAENNKFGSLHEKHTDSSYSKVSGNFDNQHATLWAAD